MLDTLEFNAWFSVSLTITVRQWGNQSELSHFHVMEVRNLCLKQKQLLYGLKEDSKATWSYQGQKAALSSQKHTANQLAPAPRVAAGNVATTWLTGIPDLVTVEPVCYKWRGQLSRTGTGTHTTLLQILCPSDSEASGAGCRQFCPTWLVDKNSTGDILYQTLNISRQSTRILDFSNSEEE